MVGFADWSLSFEEQDVDETVPKKVRTTISNQVFSLSRIISLQNKLNLGANIKISHHFCVFLPSFLYTFCGKEHYL
jgi:hypothetical protein